ncbi:MAG TPA: NmrA family NAD(P)-binding protein [Candidatus Acidoferrum sp.]|nr:NmrA family NAD(P)-binding protein [Candidatus Acidoferrum sp.]
MIVVLGSTGNTGSVVTEFLLTKKQQVRAVGRSKEHLARFASRGAETFVADLTDSGLLTKAFSGARAVFALLPPNLSAPNYLAYQDQVINSLVKALEAAKISHVVTLSSVGADKPDKTGPVVGLFKLENRLNQIPSLNSLHLRAAYFMENTLPQVSVIRTTGKMAGPLRPDLPFPVIATRDIGTAAGEALLSLDFHGHQTRELHGQRDLTYTEMAKIIGSIIGRPALTYVQIPKDQFVQAVSQMGMSHHAGELLFEMSEAMNSGHMRALETRSAKNTTPTRFEEFVQQVFVPAYKGQAARA